MNSRCHKQLRSLLAVSLCMLAGRLTAAQVATHPAQAPASQPAAAATRQTQPAVPVLIKGPYLQNLQPDGVTICLEASTQAAGRIVVRDAADKTVTEASFQATGGQITEVPLSSLKPATRYRYAVWLDEKPEPAYRAGFMTAPPPGTLPVEFLAFGDSRTFIHIFARTGRQMLEAGLPMAVHTGDLVRAGRDLENWDNELFSPGRELLANVALFPAVGNHELSGKGPDGYETFRRLFALPGRETYYSFDFGGVYFLVLDSCAREAGQREQYAWAEKDLAASKAPWKVAVFHHPWFNAGSHPSDVNMRRLFGPLFARAGVDLILVGHDHNYQRTRPIIHLFTPSADKPYWQIVTGGGGAPLYQVGKKPVFLVKGASENHFLRIRADERRMSIVAVNLDGQEIDRFEIPRGEPAAEAVPYELIELEEMLRSTLTKPSNRFVLRDGQTSSEMKLTGQNPFPVPVRLRFESANPEVWSLAADPAEVEIPAGSMQKPATADLRLVLRCLDPTVGTRQRSVPMTATYEADKIGEGTLENLSIALALVPTLRPALASSPPRIDGRLDEPLWEHAPQLGDFVETRNMATQPADLATRVQVAVDAQRLYLAVSCRMPEGWSYEETLSGPARESLLIRLASASDNVHTLTVGPDGQVESDLDADAVRGGAHHSPEGWTVELAARRSALGAANELRADVVRKTNRVSYELAPASGGSFDFETAVILPLSEGPATRGADGARPD